MDKDTKEYVLACVMDWLDIKNTYLKCYMCEYAHNEKWPSGAMTTAADVDHSSLLQRLLNGDPVLKEPPPRSYSYPSYSIAEGNEVIPMEVWFGKDKDTGGLVGDDKVVIDQGTWFIVKEISENEYIIKWTLEQESEYKLTRRTEEELEADIKNRKYASTLSDEEYERSVRLSYERGYHLWKLKLIGEPQYRRPHHREYVLEKQRKEANEQE